MKDLFFKKLLEENGRLAIEAVSGFLWTPVRTKPRQEKKFAEYCRSNSLNFYLPLRKKVKRYQRRDVEFYIPMFSGYVFCSLNQELYQKVLRSNRIVYRLQMDELNEKILIRELQGIQMFEKLAVESELIVRPELVNGSRISVRSGPLKGMNGIVEKRKGKAIITINVEILGQSVSTEIDVEDIETED